MWIKNKGRDCLNLDLQNEIQWKKIILVITLALCSHMSIFLGLSSALDHPLNLSDWLKFSPAVGKEQHMKLEYVCLVNEPRKEKAPVLGQQRRSLGRCRESENLFSIWMLCTCVTELGPRSLPPLHFLLSADRPINKPWDLIGPALQIQGDVLCEAHVLGLPALWFFVRLKTGAGS